VRIAAMFIYQCVFERKGKQMNEILKDIVFYVFCPFGAIYLFYHVGSFLVQVIRNTYRHLRTKAKK